MVGERPGGMAGSRVAGPPSHPEPTGYFGYEGLGSAYAPLSRSRYVGGGSAYRSPGYYGDYYSPYKYL